MVVNKQILIKKDIYTLRHQKVKVSITYTLPLIV